MSPNPVQLSCPNGRKISVPTGLFIDNRFVASEGNRTIDSINPVTEDVLAAVSAASEKDIDIAVASSRKAFETVWGRNITGVERGRLLNKLADLMERDIDELADLEALDNGKSAEMAKNVDITESIGCIRYYAGWADKLYGQTIEINDKASKSAETRVEPIGVCGQIIPWNYNVMMLAWKIGPALATGCTVVLKPSEITPLPALKICELFVEAGFPPGVFNCVVSEGSVGGAALAAHMDVDKVAFTGSTIVGRKIMAAAANSNLKKVTLELGGKSPHIIFPSADLKAAASAAAMGIFFNQGQNCCAGSRLFVHASIYDEFVKELRVASEGWSQNWSDPFKKGALGGPQVSKSQRDKILGYIDSAKSEGAKIEFGGEPWKGKGWFITPTAIGECKPSMKAVQEEIFGPVVVMQKFETEEEVIKAANDTTYGLAAGFHSRDASQCKRVIGKLLAGTVWVNSYGLLSYQAPFGGYKQSGIGRELGAYALENYTQIKTVLWDYSV